MSDIEVYINQTFGQALSSVKAASVTAAAVAVTLTFLITLLFMRLLYQKDRYSIAVMKSVGFTSSDITKQYVWRAVVVMMAGIAAGTLLAGTAGEWLAGAAIASFGAAFFQFQADPLSAYLLSPMILLLIAVTAAICGTRNAGRILIS